MSIPITTKARAVSMNPEYENKITLKAIGQLLSLKTSHGFIVREDQIDDKLLQIAIKNKYAVRNFEYKDATEKSVTIGLTTLEEEYHNLLWKRFL
jgi:hypothetical protein